MSGLVGGAMMSEAAALLLPGTIGRLGEALVGACARGGVELSMHNVQEAKYKQVVEEFQNVITWGVKMPWAWYRSGKRRRKNFLFLENALFDQRDGVWVDARGWFADSNLSYEGHSAGRVSRRAWERMNAIADRRFHWRFFQGGDLDGPILYAVQKDRDAPCLYHFPARGKSGSAVETGLRLMAEHCPDWSVVVRPHPRYLEEWRGMEGDVSGCFRKNWTVDAKGDVYSKLTRCRALVTVNSTLATEALFLGIPVATLGRSAYTGSGACLECADDPSRLWGFFDFKPDRKKIIGYLAACMRHQIPYAADIEGVSENREFRRWLRRAASK
jgi:hypothetical protein